MAALGKSPSTITLDELGAVDEFHIGGRRATAELCEQLGVHADSKLLDIGCGIGGTARFVTATFGCRVAGIDLTPEYVEVARTLSAWTGLSEQLRFETASALEMPFADGSFDIATQLHVGMNIQDKAALFAEVFRVLRSGGRFGVYDVMQKSDAAPEYPVPWATDPSMSFLASPSTYRQFLEAAGFRIRAERDRGEFAVEGARALARRTSAAAGPPPLGLHLIMGLDAPTKIANMVAAVGASVVAPVEFICEKPAAASDHRRGL